MRKTILSLTALASLTMASSIEAQQPSDPWIEYHPFPGTFDPQLEAHHFNPNIGESYFNEWLAIVHVYVEDLHGESFQATGFFVGPHMVLTNYHVIRNIKSAIIKFGNERTYKVQNWWGNPLCDVAVLNVPTVNSRFWFQLAVDSSNEVINEHVTIDGYPGDKDLISEGPITHFVDRNRNIDSGAMAALFLIFASGDHGQSGAPVFNEKMDVIGMVRGGNPLKDEVTVITSNVIWEALKLKNRVDHPTGFITGVTSGLDLRNDDEKRIDIAEVKPFQQGGEVFAQ
jgi:S1-C subfamily serine protease